MVDTQIRICHENKIESQDLFPISIESLLDSFLSGKSEKTLVAYRQDLEDFKLFVRQGDIRGAAEMLLTRGHGQANALVLAYKAEMQGRGLAAATINRRLAAIRSLVSLASMLGIIPWKIEIRNIKSEPYRDTQGPGTQAVKRILQQLEKQNGSKAIRDYAIVRLLYDLALRRNEVCSLDVHDIDFERGVLFVVGKGRTEKCTLSLPKATLIALKKWLDNRGNKCGPLFINLDRAGKGERLTPTSVYRIVCALGKKIGCKVRPHGLRHSAITNACIRAQENGIPIEEVLDFSRHKDVETLLIYRDRERNVQGQIASLVANDVSP